MSRELSSVAVVLNWRAAQETVRCVDSILEFAFSIDHVVVVDNCSADDSVKILNQKYQHSDRVTVLENKFNSGYAGGNNYGIKFALNKFEGLKYFWVVNNDAYILNDAFESMLAKLESNGKVICGSVIIEESTNKLQCYGGGKLYPILGKAKLVGSGKVLSNFKSQSFPDYIMGCSLAFCRQLVNEVGYMDESYFMYSEEIDWQFRAKKVGYQLQVADDSVVYHQSSLSSGKRSEFYYYYRNRAAIFFNKKFYGVYFAAVSSLLLSLITLAQEAPNYNLVKSGVKGALSGLKMKVLDEK